MLLAASAGAGAPALVPANDNTAKWDGRRVLSWPTAARLLAADRNQDLRLLWHWRALSDMALQQPANDNLPGSSRMAGGAAEEAIEEVDALMGFRPTVGEIMTATDPATWLGWHKGRRAEIVARDDRTGSNLRGPAIRKVWAGLLFDGRNRLIGYRTSPEQQWLQQATIVRGPRQTASEVSPDSIAATRRTSTTEEHLEARSDFRELCSAIGQEHADVLELAVGPSTAKQIGETRRYVGKTAERWGIRMVDDALSALSQAYCP